VCSRNCSPPTSAPSSSAWCLRCACAGLVLVLPVLVVVLQLELILTKLGRESSNLLLLHSSLLHHPIPAIPSLSLCCFGSVQQPLIHCAVPVVSALHTHSPALCPSSLRDDSSNPPFGCAARPARPAQPSPARPIPSRPPPPVLNLSASAHAFNPAIGAYAAASVASPGICQRSRCPRQKNGVHASTHSQHHLHPNFAPNTTTLSPRPPSSNIVIAPATCTRCAGSATLPTFPAPGLRSLLTQHLHARTSSRTRPTCARNTSSSRSRTPSEPSANHMRAPTT